MKVQILYLAVCSLTAQAVYISRMSTISRTRAPTAFRPGVSLQRPWNHPRYVQAGSHRAPYVLYRNSPHRYMTKPYNQGTRSVYNIGTSGPWKTTSRFPSSSTPEYEFVRSASVQHPLRSQSNGAKGAIHTIPAPNLSLSEKPIVVLETAENVQQSFNNHVATDAPKLQTYEVTEKHVDPMYYHSLMGVKTIEAAPAGFSKQGTISSQDLNALVRNSAALQMANDFGLQAITLPQQPTLIQQQPQPIAVQFQGFHGLHHSPQDLMRQGVEGLIIPPNALYQDPSFLQTIQNQLLKRYPSIEFVPYTPEIQPVSTPSQVLVVNDASTQPSQQLSVLPIEQGDNHKTVIRETQESVVSLVPQALTANVTENEVEVATVVQPHNVTLQIVPAEPEPQTSTVKYVTEATTEDQKVTPIYYAQVGQSVGNIIANGFYSAINDVRAAAAMAQVDVKKPEEIKRDENVTTTTTVNPDVKTFFVHNSEKNEHNETVNDFKSLLGVPFAKTDSVKLAYTLLRADDKAPQITKEGTVYAGQIIEASITEDKDFKKDQDKLMSKRPALRLVPVSDIKPEPKPTQLVSNQQPVSKQETVAPAQKISVVKAKIPPKSKLIFDDKTGEPILRIYASYVDSPLQTDLMTTKLANMKHVKETARKQESNVDSWKAGAVKTLHSREHSSSDINKVTQFGLKLRSRMDDIVPIFDDYEN